MCWMTAPLAEHPNASQLIASQHKIDCGSHSGMLAQTYEIAEVVSGLNSPGTTHSASVSMYDLYLSLG